MEYHDESSFVSGKKTLDKYRCAHCKRVPKVFYECLCAHQAQAHCRKNGLSCTTCLHLPCKNCGESGYVEDLTRAKNVSKLLAFCPNKEHGCADKPPLESVERHLRDKCSHNRCKYREIGCMVEVRGRERALHEATLTEHFDLLVHEESC